MELMGTTGMEEDESLGFHTEQSTNSQCVPVSSSRLKSHWMRCTDMLLNCKNPCNHLGCFPAVKRWAGVSRHREAEAIDGIHPHGALPSCAAAGCGSPAALDRADNAPAPNKAQLWERSFWAESPLQVPSTTQQIFSKSLSGSVLRNVWKTSN